MRRRTKKQLKRFSKVHKQGKLWLTLTLPDKAVFRDKMVKRWLQITANLVAREVEKQSKEYLQLWPESRQWFTLTETMNPECICVCRLPE